MIQRVGPRQRLIVVTVLLAALAVTGVRLHGRLLDLFIYRMGAHAVLSGGDALYSAADPATGLVFTYPPFSALAFVPLDVVGQAAAELIVTLASILALARVCVLLHRAAPSLPEPAALLLLAAPLEPVLNTVAFGQVNLLLMWLVCEDLLGRRWRGTGVLVGLAAAIKLVPGIFIAGLLVAGRFRDAAVAAGTVLVTLAVSAALLPHSTWLYFTDLAYHDTRLGGVSYISNQSVNGVLWRLLGPGGSVATWAVLAVVVVGFGLWTAARHARAGQPVPAVAATALTGLLASPVSWSHHWVWLVVVAAALWSTGRRALAAVSWAVPVGWAIWWVPNTGDREYHLEWWQQIVGNSYALVAVAALVGLATVRLPARQRTAALAV